MRLPDFFVIGACRAGTTALFAALREHPEIFMPPVKEPHFFLSDDERSALASGMRHDLGRWHFTGPVSDPLDYARLFAGASAHQVVGEGSTGYLGSPTAARRISESLPRAKIIAILRDPVARAHAHYWFDVMWDFERAGTFEQALARREPPPDAKLPLDYVHHGLYHGHLSRYYERFAPDQIRVYLYEDWRDSPAEMLSDLCSFLGVDPELAPSADDRNVTYAPRSRRLRRLALSGVVPGLERLERRHNLIPPPPMLEETRRSLGELYRDDIGRLENLLGRDLSRWLAPQASEASRAAA